MHLIKYSYENWNSYIFCLVFETTEQPPSARTPSSSIRLNEVETFYTRNTFTGKYSQKDVPESLLPPQSSPKITDIQLRWQCREYMNRGISRFLVCMPGDRLEAYSGTARLSTGSSETYFLIHFYFCTLSTSFFRGLIWESRNLITTVYSKKLRSQPGARTAVVCGNHGLHLPPYCHFAGPLVTALDLVERRTARFAQSDGYLSNN